MTPLERTALLSFSAEEMFSLVSDIEAYPQFLPGCVSARIESAEAELVQARLGFRIKGLNESFATQNRMIEGRRIEMKLLEGPFRRLSGVWEFLPLAEKACKVSLKLDLDFGSRLLEGTLGPLIDRAIGGIMDAFKARAGKLYGGR